MASSIAGINLTTPTILSKSSSRTQPFKYPLILNVYNSPHHHQLRYRKMYVVAAAAPEKNLSDLVAESVKEAEEACAENPVSGECVAAWDVVEEASAAASHARDRKKETSDALENYCKDNPETDECRTYDN